MKLLVSGAVFSITANNCTCDINLDIKKSDRVLVCDIIIYLHKQVYKVELFDKFINLYQFALKALNEGDYL